MTAGARVASAPRLNHSDRLRAVDASLSGDDNLTFEGDGYLGEVGEVLPALAVTGKPAPMPPLTADIAGGYVYATLTHRVGEGGSLTLRASYDRAHRDDPTFADNADTVNLELQSRLQLPGSQEVLMGASYRLMADRFQGKNILDLRPGHSADSIYSAFIQDNIALFGNALRITIGTKLEHNDFSGFEIQPGVRLAWEPSSEQTVWAAVSRSVRVPTRLERDLFAVVGPPDGNPVVEIRGNGELDSETLIASELGYRLRATPSLFFDLAGFYFHYEGLMTLEVGSPFVENGQNVQPILYENKVHGHSYGGEAAITFAPLPTWKLVASYSYLQLSLDPEGMDLSKVKQFEGASPSHQLAFRSLLNLPAGIQLDGFVRWVDELTTSAGGQPIPSYLELDARASWQALRTVELSVVGQSLLHDHHPEFAGGTEVERSLYGMVTARF